MNFNQIGFKEVTLLQKGHCRITSSISENTATKKLILFPFNFNLIPYLKVSVTAKLDGSYITIGESMYIISGVSLKGFEVQFKKLHEEFRVATINWTANISNAKELDNDVNFLTNGNDNDLILKRVVYISTENNCKVPLHLLELLDSTSTAKRRAVVVINNVTDISCSFSILTLMNHSSSNELEMQYVEHAFNCLLTADESNIEVIFNTSQTLCRQTTNSSSFDGMHIEPIILNSSDSIGVTAASRPHAEHDVWIEGMSADRFTLCLLLLNGVGVNPEVKEEKEQLVARRKDARGRRSVHSDSPGHGGPAALVDRADFMTQFANCTIDTLSSPDFYSWYRACMYGRHVSTMPTSSRFNLRQGGVLLEGDSLLMHFLGARYREDGDDSNDRSLSEARLDAMRSSGLLDSSFGHPTLHLCYLVHQHLATYHAHGVEATVVFFDTHEQVYAHNGYLLLRQAVLRSLQSVDRVEYRVGVRRFDSFLSGEFGAFLAHRVAAFAPLELMLLDTNMSLNMLYSALLLDRWGLAVGAVDGLDLLGAARVMDPEQRGDQTQYDAEAVRLIEKMVEGANCLDACTSQTTTIFHSSRPGEVSLSALRALITSIAASHSDLSVRSFAQSHLLSLDLQRVLSLGERFLPQLTGLEEEDSVELVQELQRYREAFSAGVMVATRGQPIEEKDLHASLFVGDLWDGRLLAAVHLFRLGKSLPSLMGDSDKKEEDDEEGEDCPLLTVQSTLVDKVREAIGSDSSVRTTTSNIRSDIPAARLGVYGEATLRLDQHTHTNTELDLTVGEQRVRKVRQLRKKANMGGFYAACGADYFDSLRGGGQTHSHPTHTVEGGAEYSVPPVAVSGLETDETALAHQRQTDASEASGHAVSGQLHLAALRSNAHSVPLGSARPRWQKLTLLNSTVTEDLVLPPRYSGLTLSAVQEGELRDRYMLEEGFRPEPWQLAMLQCIDEGCSVLITAPTSSGKTLAAEYAMRKICADNARKGTRFVGVFVQPTNALVDQTYSVFATDPNVGGHRVAMFTADVRSPNFADNSFEVLVTNPQCLQILIMSGHTRGENSFYKRLRCVVFDEIHCIGQDVGSVGSSSGVVWEQLLATVDCPIVGLSATLANAAPFFDWLVDVKRLQLQQKITSVKQKHKQAGTADERDRYRKIYNRLKLDLRDKQLVRLITHSERSTPLHFYRKLLPSDEEVLRSERGERAPVTSVRVLEPFRPVQTTLRLASGQKVVVEPAKSSSATVLHLKRIQGRVQPTGDGSAMCVTLRTSDHSCVTVIISLTDSVVDHTAEIAGHFQLKIVIQTDAATECSMSAPFDFDSLKIDDDDTWLGFKLELSVCRYAENSRPSLLLSMSAELCCEQEMVALVTSVFCLGSETTVNALEVGPHTSEDNGDTCCVLLSLLEVVPVCVGAQRSVAAPHSVSLHSTSMQLCAARGSDQSLNPLSFLPAVDHLNPDQLRAFFGAVPHMKLVDLLDVFGRLVASPGLQRVQLSQEQTARQAAMSRSQSVLRSSGLNGIYSEMRALFADKFLDPVFAISSKPLELAHCRLQFDALVAQMHTIVLGLPSFEDRFIVDSLCAHALNRSGLDWYGQQWLEDFSLPAESLDGFFDAAWSELSCKQQPPSKGPQINAQPTSAITAALTRLSSCLFVNQPGPCDPSGGIYPSSISAMNRALYYWLDLLMTRDGCRGQDQEGLTIMFVKEEGGDNESISSLVHRSIVLCLQSLTTADSDQDRRLVQDRFSSTEVASLLRGMMDAEFCLDDSFTPEGLGGRVTGRVSGAGRGHTEVRRPTLIFHLNKRDLEMYLGELVQNPTVLRRWFTGTPCCFLEARDVAAIDALPGTSEAKKAALKHGVGMHIATVRENRKYRRLVEVLFQQRKLKFVFCTSSLSYGINMPCSDVLFLGDSPHLTNMVFRQSSGRAGRRGYVNSAGSISFVGFSTQSIVRKLCMPLDDLSPRQAVSPSFILRLTSIGATCHERNKRWVDNMTLRGLANPLFERLLESKHQVRDQFRAALVNSIHFSWAFLRERGFVSEGGVAQVKANIPYREHYLEPRCFLLAELLDAFLDPAADPSAGYLGLVRPDFDPLIDCEELDLNVFMSLVYLTSDSPRQIRADDPQCSEFRLPSCLRGEWLAYNQGVMALLVRYMRAHCDSLGDEVFPLCEGLAFPRDGAEEGGELGIAFRVWLRSQTGTVRASRHPSARSVFTLLSGRGDAFRCIAELLLSVRSGMIIDERIVPCCDPTEFVDRTLETTFRCAEFSASDHNAANSCEDFSRNMRGVVASLEQMFQSLQTRPLPESKADVLMRSFQRVRDKFRLQLNRAKGLSCCQGIVECVFTSRETGAVSGGVVYFLDATGDRQHGSRLGKAKFFLDAPDCLLDTRYTPMAFDCVELCVMRTGRRVQGISPIHRENNVNNSVCKARLCTKVVESIDRTLVCGVFSTQSIRASGSKAAAFEPQSFYHLQEDIVTAGMEYQCMYAPEVAGGCGFIVE